jgi:hypothetical protein
MHQRQQNDEAGWVYLLTNPSLPGICKIGQTRHTAARRAHQLEDEYGVAAPFEVVSRHAVPNAAAVEAIAHRMLADCRLPKSELFRCDVATARGVIKAAALSYETPWAITVWLRRLLHPPTVRRHGRQRRYGSDELLGAVAIGLFVGVVIWLKPAPPAWVPMPVAELMVTLERF